MCWHLLLKIYLQIVGAILKERYKIYGELIFDIEILFLWMSCDFRWHLDTSKVSISSLQVGIAGCGIVVWVLWFCEMGYFSRAGICDGLHNIIHHHNLSCLVQTSGVYERRYGSLREADNERALFYGWQAPTPSRYCCKKLSVSNAMLWPEIKIFTAWTYH